MRTIDEQILDLMRARPTFDEMLANSQRIAMTPYGLQDGNGVDVTLIQDALRRSPDERVRRSYEFTRGVIETQAHVRSQQNRK